MRLILSLLALLFAAPLAAMHAAAGDARVAAAISLKEPLTQAAADFEKSTGRKVTLSFGSSGQIVGQIKAGARIDLFISAGQPQIDQLAQAGLIDADKAVPIAANRLVVVTPADSSLVITGLKDLASKDVKWLAVGEPKTVPAGLYARQALDKAGVSPQLEGRLVFGANVRQVLNYVERGEASAGIVYASDAQTSAGKVRVAHEIPQHLHTPVLYPAALVTTSKHKPQAQAFLDYLLSEPGQKTLKAHGLTPVR
jgi:molybdate transport system substrate-binding protein